MFEEVHLQEELAHNLVGLSIQKTPVSAAQEIPAGICYLTYKDIDYICVYNAIGMYVIDTDALAYYTLDTLPNHLALCDLPTKYTLQGWENYLRTLEEALS